MSRSHFRIALILAALVALARVVAADDLPPHQAPGFSAVYHLTSRSREHSQDDWTVASEDTVTISVLATKLSRWEYKSDGHWVLNDQVARRSTTFGGRNPPNTATSSQAPFTPIGWEFGYDVVFNANEGKVDVLGKTTIAGKECTRLKLVSAQYGVPEFCVTKAGIVLRFANQSSTLAVVHEAQSLDQTAPDPQRFPTPVGTKAERRAQVPPPWIF